MSDKSLWEKYKDNLGETRPWDLLDPSVERVTDNVAEERYSSNSFTKSSEVLKGC